MKINLWYSDEVDQWRWTLTSDTYTSIMESGNSEDLREAMDDVANTVEWLLDTEVQEQYNTCMVPQLSWIEPQTSNLLVVGSNPTGIVGDRSPNIKLNNDTT